VGVCINSKGDNTDLIKISPKFLYCCSPENFDWHFVCAISLELKSR
jgi:hypothetical protein